MKIIVTSGGFDPVHSGHIKYLKEASRLGDKLLVCLNSDNWLLKKKGKFLLPFEERKLIIESLKFVDEVIGFEDDMYGSVKNGLLEIKKRFPEDQIIFCNGGDRNKKNIPESNINGIDLKFSIGGDEKINSSSLILENWKKSIVNRKWGNYYNLIESKNLKLKVMSVLPNSKMSFQRHNFRNEFWFVSEGRCLIKHSKSNPEKSDELELKLHDSYQIKVNEWHQIINPYKKKCEIIEIQFGSKVKEGDIERIFENE